MKIREIDSHLVNIAIGVLMNDYTVDSRAEECLIIEDHLFLKNLMRDGLYRIHGF